MSMTRKAALIASVAALATVSGTVRAMDIVKEGKPVVSVWHVESEPDAKWPTEQAAAEEFAEVVKKISGADLVLNAVKPG